MEKIKLEVTRQEVNVIMEAISQMPLARAFNLFISLQEQLKAQLGETIPPERKPQPEA